MNEKDYIVEKFKDFCKAHGFEYRGCFGVGKAVAVYWRGEMCVTPFLEWADSADFIKGHTTPRLMPDGNGKSESFFSYLEY